MEAAAKRDLAALPGDVRTGAVATALLMLARRLDAGVGTRDSCLLVKEIRMCTGMLYELAPPVRAGDPVDELRVRREQRMTEQDSA